MKNGFILYKDTKPMIDRLTVEQAGFLLKSVFEFQETGVQSCSDPMADLVLSSIVSHFKRDAVKYKETCLNRSEAGRNGAKQKLAKAGKRKICKQKLATQADSDTDSDTDSDINNISADFLKRFNEATGKNFRVLNDAVCEQLNARLKEGFTVEEIIQAAKNCSQDEYHKEHTTHLTPEFILRADKLQKYLNVKSANKPTTKDWIYHCQGFGGSNVNKENQTFEQFCKLHKIGVFAE